ncbi:hypothetical protein EJ08DRAFT_252447 [Tothia fuscella]|uniref:DUF6594 domain-containing protein n=1 Tax=Tothia fuscella TaxID=1048955 RepID=A0A9P4NRH5_9PEZI|nr:hypothetical protein EJ08DRAFT_252447 [Tothia fuscella]
MEDDELLNGKKIDITDSETEGHESDPQDAPVQPSSRRRPAYLTALWGAAVNEVVLWAESIHSYISSKPYVPDDRHDRVKHEKIKDYPAGYPQLAALLNSDPDYPIYRRFGTLRSRVLLHRQYELAKLESKLSELDQKDAIDSKYRLTSIRRDQADGDQSERTDLVNEIDQKLKNYDDLIFRERRSQQLPKASNRNFWNVFHYIWNEKSIVLSEMQFFEQRDDFILLSQEPPSPFHEWVSTMVLRYGGRRFQSLLATKQQLESTDNEYIHLWSRSKIAVLVQMISTVVFTILLMIPVGLLSKSTMPLQAKLGIIFGSIIAFPIFAYIFSRPPPHHLCAMTATYAAVLVVFLSNFSNVSITNSQP